MEQESGDSPIQSRPESKRKGSLRVDFSPRGYYTDLILAWLFSIIAMIPIYPLFFGWRFFKPSEETSLSDQIIPYVATAPIWIVVSSLSGLVYSLPFFIFALVIACIFRKQIEEKPAIWCGFAPFILSFVMMFLDIGSHWLDLRTLYLSSKGADAAVCAFLSGAVAGLIFYRSRRTAR